MSDLVGCLVAGKYRVVQRLGSGGVADVYEAVHERIGQRTAIKILKAEFLRIPGTAERFLTEARVAGAVGHPGIVQVFDYGHLPSGEPYLVMELLDQDDLYKVLQRVKRFEVEHAVGILLHVLDALDAAHRAGIVHRDMKPENVIITRGPGGEPWAKIIDFGIAHVISAGAAPPRQTAIGTVIGTPHYLSPEQARGQQDIDARTDIYSVGVMLFELLTGKLPFEGNTGEEVIERVLAGPFPSPRRFNPSIPAAIEQVIVKATAHRREDRYASATEFLDALRPFKGVPAGGLPAPPGVGPPPPRPTDASTPPPPESRASTPLPSGVDIPAPPPTQTLGQDLAAGTTGARTGPAAVPDAGRPRRTRHLRTWTILAAAFVGAATLICSVTSRSSGPGIPAARPGHAAARPSNAALLAVQDDPRAPASPVADGASAPDAFSDDRTSYDDRAGTPHDVVLPIETSVAVGAPAPDAVVDHRDKDAGSPRRPVALVKLAGMPPGARAQVDGREVGEVFPMEVSDESHSLLVAGQGWKPLVQEFRVRGELTIPVRLEPSLEPSAIVVAPAVRDGGSARPGVHDAESHRPLGNPFGGV